MEKNNNRNHTDRTNPNWAATHTKRPVTAFCQAARIDLGQQIYNARTTQGIDPADICRHVHAHGGKLCPTQLTNIENGLYPIRYDDLANLAAALGMKVMLVPE